MLQRTLEPGFKRWHEEVESSGREDVNGVPYTALIPLVGIYRALHPYMPHATSYHWRRSVLLSPDAIAGLRQNLGSFFADELDTDWTVPIADEVPAQGDALQYVLAHKSLVDGTPRIVTDVGASELFLAKNLGFAVHDDAVTLGPLELTRQGREAFHNFYPETAEWLSEQS